VDPSASRMTESRARQEGTGRGRKAEATDVESEQQQSTLRPTISSTATIARGTLYGLSVERVVDNEFLASAPLRTPK
jgi:hypothetical protein